MDITARGKNWITNRNHIISKHVDFLLCSKDSLEPRMVIELDGKSHNGSGAKKNDNFKNNLFEDIGLKFIRIHVGSNFEDELRGLIGNNWRSEEHTSELQSHSFISYAVFCLKKKRKMKKEIIIKN